MKCVRITALLILIGSVFAMTVPAYAMQYGIGLEYLHTFGDIKYSALGGADSGDLNTSNFGLLGSLTFGASSVRAEGSLELIPDYLGSGSILIQPGLHGLLAMGPMYVGVGTGIGYWSKDSSTVSPYFDLRLGGEFTISSTVIDVFTGYRYQTGSGYHGDDQVLEALAVGARVKFGD